MTFDPGEQTGQEPGEHPGELLSALLDGELDGEAAQAVDRHVDGCAQCREELTEIEQARQLLRDAAPVTAPRGLISGVITRRRRATRHGATLGFAAAAAAAAVGLLFANPVSGDTSAVRTSQGDHAGEKADRDVRPRGERPNSIRRATVTDDSRASFADRAEEAVRDLLGFFD